MKSKANFGISELVFFAFGDKMPRKSLYKEKIEPNLDKIRDALENGSTEKAVYESIGVSKSAWCGYKKSKKDFLNLIAGARACAEIKIDNAIFKAACGYFETDVKTIKGFDKDGNPCTETINNKKWHEPNMTAAAMWKRNNNNEFTDQDKSTVEQKKKELELKTAVAEDKAFNKLKIGESNE